MNIPWLEPGDPFPPTASALPYPDGLLAAGADLSVATLLEAYRQGIFPWYEQGQPILWWSPDPRLVLFPDQLHIARRFRRFLKHTPWRVSLNQHFEQVIHACAGPRGEDTGTWITTEMYQAYCDLHMAGHAHSIEIYDDTTLVGGLYGVRLGGAFFGESMFSHRTNGSKTALVMLSILAKDCGIALIDCQVESDHLLSMGATTLPRIQFESRLCEAIKAPSQPFPAIRHSAVAEIFQRDTLNSD